MEMTLAEKVFLFILITLLYVGMVLHMYYILKIVEARSKVMMINNELNKKENKEL